MTNGLGIFINNIAFKMPSLILDLIGLYYLVKMYPQQRRYVAVLYFASPIIIYSVYMHGQLDIIPTVFLIISLYYFTLKNEKNNFIAVIMLSLALASKLHILAVIPILFLFLWKKNGYKKAFCYTLTSVLLTFIISIPFLSPGYIKLVLFNNEQKILTKVFLEFVNIKIYIPIIAIVIIYLVALSISNINKDLLISLCGVLFAVFLILVPPMPGWYVWIVPFVAIFFVNSKQERIINIGVYAGLNLMYLVYFVFFHKTQYVDLYFMNKSLSFFKIDNEVMGNIIFTVLVGFLIYTTYLMYQYGIASNSLYKRKNRPFTIGIAGDSGSGKSTFIDLILELLGDKNLLFLEGDGDHKWERGEEMWSSFTHLNPKANYLYRQAMDVQNLRLGSNIYRVDYNHKTGTFTDSHKIKPRKYILMCGLHSLYLPQMRKNLDLKIYMDADEELRRYWKIQRDTVKRGYSKEKIVEQIEDRVNDAEKYVYPQKQYADLIIQYFDKTLTNCFIDSHNVVLSIKLTFSAAINIEEILWELSQCNIVANYEYSDNLKMQTVVFDSSRFENAKIDFEKLAGKVIPQLDELVRCEFKEMGTLDGIIELILLVLISHKMRGDI